MLKVLICLPLNIDYPSFGKGGEKDSLLWKRRGEHLLALEKEGRTFACFGKEGRTFKNQDSRFKISDVTLPLARRVVMMSPGWMEEASRSTCPLWRVML